MADKKLEHLTELARDIKAKKFVNKYYAENGVMPSLAEVNAAKALSDDDMAKINQIMAVDNLVDMAGDYSGGTIVITGETVSNLDVPADPAIKAIKAEFEDTAVINFSTVKSVGVENLGNNVIESLTVNAPASSANTTITVSANCGTITAVNANVTVPAPYTVENIILITSGAAETSNIAVNANFAENASIDSETSNPIAVNNKNGEDNLPNLTINAENATVTLNNKWNEVEASVSENTLIVNGFGHINKLTVNKGNVIVNVPRQTDIAGVIDNSMLAPGCSIDYLKKEVTNANVADLCSIGEMTLMENVARATSFVTPIGTVNAVWKLNGHNVEITGNTSQTRSGLYLNRYSSSLEINGEGTLRCANNYGLWNNSATGKIVINGGNVEAETHAVYAQTGVIEINGGSFKLTNADTAERDENNNLKFLINCLDANYKAGTANIVVKGGKFYEFDPANNVSEGPGTNYVAAGYQSTMSMEEGKKVYTVTKL